MNKKHQWKIYPMLLTDAYDVFSLRMINLKIAISGGEPRKFHGLTCMS